MGPMNYNEKKVEKGDAKLIHACGYVKDIAQMSFQDKLDGFERLISRNSSTTNSLHISLNFANADSLDKGKLVQIADEYMDKIGFGKQPYLVYQHFDAGHPHVHIVTTTIQANGKRIDTFGIGATKSEKARKEIEIGFGLTRAEDSKIEAIYSLKGVDVQKAIYGKTETKKAISIILDKVLGSFHYTSLPELNAVLRQYNVFADQGSVDSVKFKKGGLSYRILSEDGKPIGIPIKASSLHGKPTLPSLQSRFARNKQRRPDKKKLTNAIDRYFLEKNVTFEGFVASLETKGVYTVVRSSDKGQIYGITFVDLPGKVVFNGSSLGKQYSASAIQQRLGAKDQNIEAVSPPSLSDKRKDIPIDGGEIKGEWGTGQGSSDRNSNSESLLDVLLQNEYTAEQLPYQLRRIRKKKRKRKN